MTNYPRGSEWRRWDLHIHTPETQKNDQFDGSTPENKWSKFVESINSYKDDIAVVGITDYCSIDNYIKFIEKIKSGEITKKFDLVLPNVELRILPVAKKSPVNIHCIFNPEIVEKLNTWFFTQLKIKPNKKTYTATKDELIQLGRDYNGDQGLNEKKAYQEGIGQFVLELSDLEKVFERKELRKNTIIAVSNNDGDGASGTVKHISYLLGSKGSQLDSTRFKIYSFSDFVFSSSSSDVNYFLGNTDKDTEEEVKEKYGKLIPCVHGSDAHTNSDLFEPDKKKYCWIKANPTFEGLKQIKFEPDERVKIQEIKPDDKSIYQVIDHVKYQDNSFMPDQILLNENLVTIIGGKSTGKSLLLRNIAKTIDPIEVKNRLKEVDLRDYSRSIEGFQVKWKDNQIQNISDTQEIKKKIIYIPQSYLNRLIDKQESSTPIDNIIEKILKQDDHISQLYDQLGNKFRDAEKHISNIANDLFFEIEDVHSLRENLKELGDKKGLSDEIERLESEVQKLEKSSGLPDKEYEEYSSLKKEIEEINRQEKNLKSDSFELTLLRNDSLFEEREFNEISHFNKKSLEKGFKELKNDTDQKWIDLIDERIRKTNDQIQKVVKGKDQLIENFKPLNKKVKEAQSLQNKIEKLDNEREKFEEFEKIEEEINSYEANIQSKIKALVNSHNIYFSNLNDTKASLVKNHNFGDDLEFDINITFRKKDFTDGFIEEVLNLRYLKKFDKVDLDDFKYTSIGSFRNDLQKIIYGILNGKIILKQNYSKKEALLKLLQNWHIFDYKIEKDGDVISDMSPGKKSFVLLKLLIDLDQSKCPILLDQPEDDLDNRSIYDDLVRFIREKKKSRQIIIATHNPNLVVSSDSEQVIVANQEGAQSPNKDYKFEYVSGALENSFIKSEVEFTLEKQGIQEHVCDILEGGRKAFENRQMKYRFS
jgi:ABC-type cobalamin/Fe3+-siderophores transport system ATPase subunit